MKTDKQLLFERMNTIGGMPIKEEIDWEEERKKSDILNKKRIGFVRNLLKKYDPNYRLKIERTRSGDFRYQIIDTLRPQEDVDRIIWFGNDAFGYLNEEDFKRWISLVEKAVSEYQQKQNNY